MPVRHLVSLVALSTFSLVGSAAEAPLTAAPIADSLLDAARQAAVPVASETQLALAPHAGDRVTLFIAARQGETVQQWLMSLVRVVPNAREKNAGAGKTETRYLSWGPKIAFKSEAEAMEVWIAGPVTVPPSAGSEKSITSSRAPLAEESPTGFAESKEERPTPTPVVSTKEKGEKPAALVVRTVRITVPGDLLRLGLDRVARVNDTLNQRVAAIRQDDPSFKLVHIYSLSGPVKPEAIKEAQPVAERVGFDDEMARAWVGGHVALKAFYSVAEEVKALRQIAEIAIEKPSLVQLSKLMTGTHFRSQLAGDGTRNVAPGPMGLFPVTSETYDMPFGFSLGKESITGGRIVATAPQAPLDLTAGILGLIAVHPKDRDRFVQVKVIAISPGKNE